MDRSRSTKVESSGESQIIAHDVCNRNKNEILDEIKTNESCEVVTTSLDNFENVHSSSAPGINFEFSGTNSQQNSNSVFNSASDPEIDLISNERSEKASNVGTQWPQATASSGTSVFADSSSFRNFSTKSISEFVSRFIRGGTASGHEGAKENTNAAFVDGGNFGAENCEIKPDYGLNERVRLKNALKVLRSNLKPSEKLLAIKKSCDVFREFKNSEDNAKWLENLSTSFIRNTRRQNNEPAVDNLREEPAASCSSLKLNSNENIEFAKQLVKLKENSNMEKTCTNEPTDSMTIVHSVSDGDASENAVKVKSSENSSHEDRTHLPDSGLKEKFCQSSNEGNENSASLSSSTSASNVLSFKDSQTRPAEAKHNAQGMSGERLFLKTSSTGASGFACDKSSPKSPITIQDWVDSINLCHQKSEEEILYQNPNSNSESSEAFLRNLQENEDNFHLGAEAKHLEDEKNEKLQSKEEKCTADVRNRRLLQMKEKQGSFHSDASSLSISTLSSIETLLESRKDDPEEILLSLGFGGNNKALDPLARIPKRFLRPSKVRGNNLDDFVRHQEEVLETLDTGFCGYRGLSGFLKERCQPGGIVGKILKKIKETDRDIRQSSPTAPTLNSFSEVAFSVMAANTFRKALLKPQNQHSILEPANREFLDAPVEEKHPPGRRLILGADEFSVDGDGKLLPAPKINEKTFHHSINTHKNGSEFNDGALNYSVKEEENISKSPFHQKLRVGKNRKLWGLYQLGNRKMNSTDEIDRMESSGKKTLIKTQTLVRQNSVCESDFVEDVQPEVGSNNNSVTGPHDSIYQMTPKESFELEEISASADDHETSVSPVSDLEHLGISRLSARSDSSGFLEGETSEPVNEGKLLEKEENSEVSNIAIPLTHNPIIRPHPLWPAVSDQTINSQYSYPTSPVSSTLVLSDVTTHIDHNFAIENYFRPISPLKKNKSEQLCLVDTESNGLQLVVSDQDNNIVTYEHFSLFDNKNLEDLTLESSNPDLREEEVNYEMNNSKIDSQKNELSHLLGTTDSEQFGDLCSSETGVDSEQKFEPETASLSGVTFKKLSVSTESNNSGQLIDFETLSVEADQKALASPVIFKQEEDEYQDLRMLLCLISNKQDFPAISKEEFCKRSPAERVQLEAQILSMALGDYCETLVQERSTLEHFKAFDFQITQEEKRELEILNEIHHGIYQEVTHMQKLLNLRIQQHLQMTDHSSHWIACSMKVIKQMSLLLYQQKLLCKQLEYMRMKEVDNVLQLKSNSLPSASSLTFTSVPLTSSQRFSSAFQAMKNFQQQIVAEVQDKLQQENSALKQELQENRRELADIKRLVLQLLAKDVSSTT